MDSRGLEVGWPGIAFGPAYPSGGGCPRSIHICRNEAFALFSVLHRRLASSGLGSYRWRAEKVGWSNRLVGWWCDDRGAALVEWGLLVVLIAIVALIAVTAAGTSVSETYSEISSNLQTAGG